MNENLYLYKNLDSIVAQTYLIQYAYEVILNHTFDYDRNQLDS